MWLRVRVWSPGPEGFRGDGARLRQFMQEARASCARRVEHMKLLKAEAFTPR